MVQKLVAEVPMGVRKLKTDLPLVSKAKLEALIEEAVVDAYTEEEQAGGFLVMIQEHLALPFTVNILGAEPLQGSKVALGTPATNPRGQPKTSQVLR